MKNRILITLLLLMGGFNMLMANNDNVSFTLKAPSVVEMNQQFRVEYTITNASPQISEPDLRDFVVLAGPSQSQSSSVYMTNGSYTRQTSLSISYILTPKKEGTFTISPSSFKYNGETIMSNAVTIKVVPAGQNTAQHGNGQGNQNGQASNATTAGNDVFIRTTFSKKTVYEQEELVATITLYHRGNVLEIEDYKMPEYKGFISKDIQLKREEQPGTDVVNGVKYQTFKLKQTILYPQKSGPIEIEKGQLTAILQVPTGGQRRGFWGFDDIFNTMKRVRKIIPIEGTKIEVKALPSEGKPADFNNAVGSFKMESDISSTEVKAYEPITIKVKITGSGNLKYVKSPTFEFPSDFDTYPPKENQKITGNSGTREIDYLVIPRHAGTFEIPAATFSYFDLNTKRYNTLKTKSFTLNVEKGDNNADNSQVISNYTNKENVKYLGTDLRYINVTNTTVEKSKGNLFGTFGFWLWYIIPLLLFITLAVLYRKQIKENANIALVKNKRANKQAKKRLKQAETYLKNGESEAFYEEVMKALWGYIGDKLNIPTSQLNKENIEQELENRSVSEETIRSFMDILSTCEFARFAKSDSQHSMDELYNQAADVIG
ncbi:MAG: protein BatD, partial [Paludibacteraceae bacterium]|nr:protein BatD [Paludibacteraceae bacterium]